MEMQRVCKRREREREREIQRQIQEQRQTDTEREACGGGEGGYNHWYKKIDGCRICHTFLGENSGL